jgi:hypothetical protein
MIEAKVVTEIQAPAGTVWKALTDLPAYGEWNPFIRAAGGKPAAGASLFLCVETALGVPLAFKATVVVCEENRELRWRGSLLAPWLGAGEHSFQLEAMGAGATRLVHREVFSGLLPRLLSPLLLREVTRGFAAMDGALKARVERPRPVAEAPVAVAN